MTYEIITYDSFGEDFHSYGLGSIDQVKKTVRYAYGDKAVDHRVLVFDDRHELVMEKRAGSEDFLAS